MISWRGLGYGSAGSAFKTFTVLRDILVLKSRGIPLQGKEGRVLRMSVLQESPISLSLLREGGIKRLGNNTVHFSLSQSRVREKIPGDTYQSEADTSENKKTGPQVCQDKQSHQKHCH